MSLIQELVNTEAQNFGIKIVDVRIKRADLPQANSEAIYRRMQTEREREAKEFRARGAEMAVTITSTADKEVTVILANAKKQSEIMKGEGDGLRNKIFADAFARFKIIDPLKFYISVGNEQVARSRLSTIVNSRLRSVLGKQELATLLSKARGEQMSIIQEGVNIEAEKFGIQIVDVRIKRADLPQANSEAIYKRMQTEREREAKEFRARGAEMAVTITSTADKEVTVILANAKKQSEIMKGEGDGTRNRIFANAFGKDPEFFAFYRAMQAYEKALIGGDTSLILSPDSDFFKFFGDTGVIKKQ